MSNSNENIESVEVYCRVRPTSSGENNDCITVENDTTIHTNPPSTSNTYRGGAGREYKYTFSRVFDAQSSQSDVFRKVAYPVVKNFINGQNGLIFTYGVTGSGKTFTMQGTSKQPGLLPRVLDTIFNSIGDRQTKKYVVRPDKMTHDFFVQSEADAMMERQQLEILARQGTAGGRFAPMAVDEDWLREPATVTGVGDSNDRSYAVFVSFVEIYNNYVYDLLDELFEHPVTGARAPQSRNLREDARKVMYVHGSVELEVKTAEEAYDVFLRGKRRRKVAHTVLNAESSRSHSIFIVRLVSVAADPFNGEVTVDRSGDSLVVSQLALVDLAGSERTQRTGNSAGDRLREAGNINNTLMTLRMCIETLRTNQKMSPSGEGGSLVPYRDSKLTHLFKSYFEGCGVVRVLVCVSTKSEEYDETLNVMKFAEDAQEVRISVRNTPTPSRTPCGSRRGAMPPPPSPSPCRKLTTPLRGSGSSSPSSSGSDSEVESTDGWSENKESELMEALTAMNDTALCYQSIVNPWMPDLVLDSLATFHGAIAQCQDARSRRLETQRARDVMLDLLRERMVAQRRRMRRGRKRCNEANDQSIRLRQEKQVLERRVRSLEQKNEKLSKSLAEAETEKKNLSDANGELSARVRRELSEKQRQRELFEAKFQLTQQKHEENQRQLEEIYASEMESKQRKLAALRSLANSPDVSSRSGTGPRPPVAPKPVMRSRLGGTGAQANPGTSMVRRLRQNFSPPPPHANQRYQTNHRRSRSVDERWVDHHSKNEVPTGTVFQPTIAAGGKKRKSVTQLDAKIVNQSTNYVLTHQQADDDGNLETHLFKGNIIPTAGGGSAVVFNDVESLLQGSPINNDGPASSTRKRSISQPVLKAEKENCADMDVGVGSSSERRVDAAEREIRCAMSAQGGATPASKRMKESKI